MKIVLANGVFDVLHVGHVEHLLQARNMGDFLMVALTMDHAVNKGPGRPINKWEDRAIVLHALACVNSVIPCVSAVSAIKLAKPDIFVKGIDYAGGNRFTEDVVSVCKELGVEIRYTDTPKRSVTEIIKKSLEIS